MSKLKQPTPSVLKDGDECNKHKRYNSLASNVFSHKSILSNNQTSQRSRQKVHFKDETESKHTGKVSNLGNSSALSSPFKDCDLQMEQKIAKFKLDHERRKVMNKPEQ